MVLLSIQTSESRISVCFTVFKIHTKENWQSGCIYVTMKARIVCFSVCALLYAAEFLIPFRFKFPYLISLFKPSLLKFTEFNRSSDFSFFSPYSSRFICHSFFLFDMVVVEHKMAEVTSR